jgi:hypothetical protein
MVFSIKGRGRHGQRSLPDAAVSQLCDPMMSPQMKVICALADIARHALATL